MAGGQSCFHGQILKKWLKLRCFNQKIIFFSIFQEKKILGNFSCFCCHPLTFFKINFFKIFFQKHYQSVKQFGSRPGLTFCLSWSGSKLFAKVIKKKRQKPLPSCFHGRLEKTFFIEDSERLIRRHGCLLYVDPFPVIFFCPEYVVCLIRLLHIFKCTTECFYLGINHYDPDQKQSDLGPYCLQYRLPKNTEADERADDTCREWREKSYCRANQE